MSQAEHAANLFFATVHEGDMSAYEKRLLAYELGVGRKPVVRGRRGSPPVPSVEQTLRAFREGERRRGLRPRVKFEFTDRQLAIAQAAMKGTDSRG